MTDQNRGRVYERRLAKEKDMELQPYSGAGVFKEDLVGEWEVIQAKSTGNGSTYKLERQDMINVVKHAAQTGKIGVLFLEWDRDEYVMLRRVDYESNMQFKVVYYCHSCCDELKGLNLFCEKCKHDA